MKEVQERNIRRKLRTSSLSTMLSISLVLLMLGSMGFIYLNTQRLINYIKENVGFTLVLKENIKKVDRLQLQKNLDASPEIKSTIYISKDDAAKILINDLGEDFINFLGFNPLSASIDVYMNAEYAKENQIETLESKLKKNPIINEIIIQKDLIADINKNVRKISLILISFSILLLIVAIALINNTIRLTVYSQRFNIKSMKLVGATNSFIRKPFLKNSMLQGLFSSLIGIVFLIFALFSLHKEMPELLLIEDISNMLIIFLIMIVFGVLMSTIVTNISVGKYLNMNENDLYH